MAISGKLNGFTLKLIACITMIIDHFAVLFLDFGSKTYMFSRIIGRISFPLFAFLLIEGFFHSSNLKKYIIRLAILAIISEPFFDYFLIRAQLKENFSVWYSQNVVFTLLLGLVTVCVYDIIVRRFHTQPVLCNLYCVLILLCGTMTSFFLITDYSVYGVLLIFIMYLFHKNRLWMMMACAANILLFGTGMIQLFAMTGVFLIWFYNGEEGKKIQRVFYLFYPLHIVILGTLHMLIK